MKNWYETSTKSNLDRNISVFTQNKTVMSQVVSLIHNNSNFLMLDVIFPSGERAHGEVFIYD